MRIAWRNLSYWKKIASNVKSARKLKRLTEVQVSETLGISLKRYRKLERGETAVVTLEEIMSIIKLFDVCIDEIIPAI